LEGKIKGLHTCIKDLWAIIEDIKALNNEKKWKVAKTEEVQGIGGQCAQARRSIGV
jgi:hypothetical protein